MFCGKWKTWDGFKWIISQIKKWEEKAVQNHPYGWNYHETTYFFVGDNEQ